MSYHQALLPRSCASRGGVSPITANLSSSKPHVGLKEEVGTALVRNRVSFLRYLRRRFRTAQDAEDALHDFYVRALQSCPQVADRARLDAWLHRVLRSTVIDRYRRTAARERVRTEFAAVAAAAFAGDVSALECEYLDACIAMLKPEFADLLRRAYTFGQPYAEIAAEVGATEGSIAVKIHRARKALLKVILNHCETCPSEHCPRAGTPGDG